MSQKRDLLLHKTQKRYQNHPSSVLIGASKKTFCVNTISLHYRQNDHL